tara:strand:+ start:2322 stop:2864 length:543 start_codon:yes stop_codon:yes gene_type:complete
MERKWETVSKKIIYDNDRYKIRLDKVKGFEGIERDYAFIEKSDAVVIIALEEDCIYFLKQYRYPVNKVLLQLPAGALDGKDMHQAAREELEEETGITAKNWTFLGKFHPLSPRQTSTTHVFLATGLNTSNITIDKQSEYETIQSIEKISITELKDMIRSNKIECGESLASLTLFFLNSKL